MRLELNELDGYFVVNLITAFSMVLLGAFSDFIFNFFQVSYSQGFGLMQLLWIAFWVAYSGYALYFMQYYGK
jgi:hypothetical protein